jgi:large subunit ribosomal protein L21
MGNSASEEGLLIENSIDIHFFPARIYRTMPFAIIETGGKQYKITEGQTLQVEKLPGDFKENEKVIFDKVLLIEDGGDLQIGTPYLEGQTIEAEFGENGKGKKLHIVRFRPKSRYWRKMGHRQPFTQVTFGKIGKTSKKESSQKTDSVKTTSDTTSKDIKKDKNPDDIGNIETENKAPKKENSLKTLRSRNTNKETDNTMTKNETSSRVSKD